MDEKDKKNQSKDAQSASPHNGSPDTGSGDSGTTARKSTGTGSDSHSDDSQNRSEEQKNDMDQKAHHRDNEKSKASDEVHEGEVGEVDEVKEGREGAEQEPDNEEIIAKLEEELKVARESTLRKAAEFDNLKKRTQRERILHYEDAKVDAVSKFLPIREDLKRSVDISRERKVDSGFLKGLELVLSNFDRVLEQYGVEPIEETGVPFDVNMHDAMLSQPAEDESTESNIVIQVLEPGYKIGDRVIRHAKVIVSQ